MIYVCKLNNIFKCKNQFYNPKRQFLISSYNQLWRHYQFYSITNKQHVKINFTSPESSLTPQKVQSNIYFSPTARTDIEFSPHTTLNLVPIPYINKLELDADNCHTHITHSNTKSPYRLFEMKKIPLRNRAIQIRRKQTTKIGTITPNK